jgi:hypothetical protein
MTNVAVPGRLVRPTTSTQAGSRTRRSLAALAGVVVLAAVTGGTVAATGGADHDIRPSGKAAPVVAR